MAAAVQLQNLTGAGGVNTAAATRTSTTTALTRVPESAANKPFEQVLRGAQPSRKGGASDPANEPAEPKRAIKPPKPERAESKRPRPNESRRAGDETEPADASTSSNSSSRTEAEHDSTYAAVEEEASEASPPTPEAAADGPDDGGTDGDDAAGDGQAVAIASDAVTGLAGSPLAAQGQFTLDGQVPVDGDAGADGEAPGQAAANPTKATAVQAIGAAATESTDTDAEAPGESNRESAGAIRLGSLAGDDEPLDGSADAGTLDADAEQAIARALDGQQLADDATGQQQPQQQDQPNGEQASDPSLATTSATGEGESRPVLKQKDDSSAADATASGASPMSETHPQQQQTDTTGATTVQKAATAVQAFDAGAAPRQPAAPAAPMHAPAAVPVAPPVPTSAETMFAQSNHGPIVSSIRHELLPNGGSMQIRLDPPELGALQVSVRMADGVVTAQFQTSNDDATRLLSHSLHQLKHALESQGVAIDKIQVQQAPRDQQASNDSSSSSRDGQSSQNQQDQQQQSRNEQQRRELMERLWRRLNGAEKAPIDLVA